MGRAVLKSDKIDLLAYPPPFSCWLALCSDPDATTFETWQVLHQLIWAELRLPFADSFFITNRNLQWSNQVSLTEHPEVLTAHPHDTMHTWGDYIFSGSYRFTRTDAVEGLQRLQGLGVVPRVWTDHSNFSGNLLHRASTQATPFTMDRSGHQYVNELYTLDLIRAAGVRYVWDGTLQKHVVGQDRHVTAWRWYEGRYRARNRLAMVLLDRVTRPFDKLRNQEIFSYSPAGNAQDHPHQFPDGSRLYCFPRFGSWGSGDIDGLGSLLAPAQVERLIESQGTAVVYTHLGKRHVSRRDAATHVSEATVQALRNLAEKHHAGAVQISPTAQLLDYLVLRDHIRIDGTTLRFEPDAIRFPDLAPRDLEGHSFGLRLRSRDITVMCHGTRVRNVDLEPMGDVHRLRIH